MKWHNTWTSVLVLHMKESTTNLAFIKFLQDGFQNDSQKSTSTTVWQSAKAFWTTFVMKGMLFWDALSLEMRCGSTITSQRANTRVLNGKIRHHRSKRSSKVNHRTEKWCSHFSGTHKAQFWNTITRRAQREKVSVIVKCFGTSLNQLFDGNVEGFRQKV